MCLVWFLFRGGIDGTGRLEQQAARNTLKKEREKEIFVECASSGGTRDRLCDIANGTELDLFGARPSWSEWSADPVTLRFLFYLPNRTERGNLSRRALPTCWRWWQHFVISFLFSFSGKWIKWQFLKRFLSFWFIFSRTATRKMETMPVRRRLPAGARRLPIWNVPIRRMQPSRAIRWSNSLELIHPE